MKAAKLKKLLTFQFVWQRTFFDSIASKKAVCLFFWIIKLGKYVELNTYTVHHHGFSINKPLLALPLLDANS